MPQMASSIGCMDIIYMHTCCTLDLSRWRTQFYPNFAFIFAVFAWKRHFPFYIFEEIHKMEDIGSSESQKMHDNCYSLGLFWSY